MSPMKQIPRCYVVYSTTVEVLFFQPFFVNNQRIEIFYWKTDETKQKIIHSWINIFFSNWKDNSCCSTADTFQNHWKTDSFPQICTDLTTACHLFRTRYKPRTVWLPINDDILRYLNFSALSSRLRRRMRTRSQIVRATASTAW